MEEYAAADAGFIVHTVSDHHDAPVTYLVSEVTIATKGGEPMNIAGIRRKFDLTQEELAEALEISVKTLQGWEQHRRFPTGAAAKLLKIFKKHPQLFLERLVTEESDEHIETPRVERTFRTERVASTDQAGLRRRRFSRA